MRKKLFTIVETPVFTKIVKDALSEQEYRALQLELANNPTAGAVIPGSGGLRKLRWAGEGKGKSGGIPRHLLLRDIGRTGLDVVSVC